jgi:hypothetical protein
MEGTGEKMRTIRASVVIVVLSVFGWVASSSQAAGIPWGNATGSSPGFFSWENGSNATNLFGDPVAIGNSLVFFPQNFKAQSSNGVADQKSDQISVDITTAGNLNATQINIYELGDYGILGAGANTKATVFGTLVVTPITSNGATTKFDPLHTNPAMPVVTGTGNWEGNASVSYTVQNGVKKFHLTLDNVVQATSDPGTNSFIEKKLTQGIIIEIIPEPSTIGLLLCGAPLVLRRRRSQ